MQKLNPAAAVFVPSSSLVPTGDTEKCKMAYTYEGFDSEEHITPEELDELECAEEWVKTMAFIEELEADHLIELALRHAPSWRVEQIHKRTSVRVRPKVRTSPSKGKRIS